MEANKNIEIREREDLENVLKLRSVALDVLSKAFNAGLHLHTGEIPNRLIASADLAIKFLAATNKRVKIRG